MTVLVALAACTSAPAPASSSPPAPTSAASTTPPAPTSAASTTPLTAPGRAAHLLDALIAAAGSAHAIKAEFTASDATLTVVIGQKAETWAWRDGRVRGTEPDVDFVGQAIFDPRDFALADLGDLFARAARVAGSDQHQQLHVLEYSNGRVYLSVTTNPESQPVFFRPDGSLVDRLDFTTTAGLRQGLADVTARHPAVFSVGLDSASGGLYALSPGPTGVVESLRMAQLPARDAPTTKTIDGLTVFDPGLIDPQAIAAVLAQLPELTGQAEPDVTWRVERREPVTPPRLYLQAAGHAIEATLNGVIVVR